MSSSEDIISIEMDSLVKLEEATGSQPNASNKKKNEITYPSTSRQASEISKISLVHTHDVGTSTLESSPSTVVRRASGARFERKIGHRRVGEGGEITYKRIHSSQIMGSIQLGIQHTVGSLASKPKRDLLMNDFWEIESINFPPDGSSITPAHHYSEFRFKVYAPIAFRYFRDLFGIAPDDFLMSMCAAPLRELSNPGASGSIFYLTDDDEFIIKTVQHKEGEFLQKLLPGYYMNLSQNPRTLLPKFFGLYCFQCNSKNVRLVAMNNLLPSDVKMHLKYDLKGSSFGRKASKVERSKVSPVYKDLDFIEHHPNGIFLEADKYNALTKTIQRDCMVLESFQIMDYSLLVGIHNLDLARKERKAERIKNARAKLQRTEEVSMEDAPEADQGIAQIERDRTNVSAQLNRSRSMTRTRLVAHSTAMESIQAELDETIDDDDDVPPGGIPARSENDEHLLLYIGIIDILQSYRLKKKLEHTFKSIIYDGDTVSVCRPSFYAQRFQNFMSKTVFKKTPTFPLKHSPSKRKQSAVSNNYPVRSTPARTTSIAGPSGIGAGVGTGAGAGGSSGAATGGGPPGGATGGGNIGMGGGTSSGGGGGSGGGKGLTLNMSTVSISKDRYRTIPSGSSTPPPAFDDISEEGSISAATAARQNSANSDIYTPSSEPEQLSPDIQQKYVTTATYVVGEVVR